MHVTFERDEGVWGVSGLLFAVRNTSQSKCTVTGYPKVGLLDSHGASVEAPLIHRWTMGIGPPRPLHVLLLRPGDDAFFELAHQHIDRYDGGPPEFFAAVLVRLPDTSNYRRVAVATPSGYQHEIGGDGIISESPLFTGQAF
jgi:hypothetical protein